MWLLTASEASSRRYLNNGRAPIEMRNLELECAISNYERFEHL